MKSHKIQAFLRAILVIILISPCSSCMFYEVDMGFPGTVTFPKEGGEYAIYSDCYFMSANIINYKNGDSGNGSWSADTTILYCNLDWLKIECYNLKNKINIIAPENNTGKSRTLHIEIDSGGYEYAVVKVKQNG